MTTKDPISPQDKIDQVVERFITGLPARLEAIRAAHRAADWNELEHLSHRLAGAAIFGFPMIGEAAHRLELSVRGRRYDQIAELIDDLARIHPAGEA